MTESSDLELVLRTGEICVRTGKWQGDDDDRQSLDIKRGETLPACPFCGRDIDWIYIHE
jgi:hypothetical protein